MFNSHNHKNNKNKTWNKIEEKLTKNSYFEFGCAVLFFLLSVFISNTYCINSFIYFPCSLVCLCAAIITLYYALKDSSNKNKIN